MLINISILTSLIIQSRVNIQLEGPAKTGESDQLDQTELAMDQA